MKRRIRLIYFGALLKGNASHVFYEFETESKEGPYGIYSAILSADFMENRQNSNLTIKLYVSTDEMTSKKSCRPVSSACTK